jgi:membrane-bound lytic murein transglycosylase B
VPSLDDPAGIAAALAEEELLGYYREAEKAYGVGWTYLAAIHLIETNMSRIRGDSSAGARGPMQFLPSTWAIYGRGDIENTHDAIMAAARYLRASGAPADMARAIYSYNPSLRYVRAVSRFAEQMQADERAFLGYQQWRVYVHTQNGDTLLDEGYAGTG